MNIERILLQPEIWALAWQRSPNTTLALRPDNVAALRSHLEEAASDPECRAVLMLSRDAEDFCLGMDLQLLDPDAPPTRLGDDFARVLQLLHTGPFVSMAVVHGRARGGGVGLVAACDYVLATANATFALPELFWGMIPAVIYPALNLRLAPARARWLALSATTLDAQAAREWGLIDQVASDHPTGQREVRQHLRMILREDPEALIRTKELARAQAGLSLPDAYATSLELARSNLARPELALAREAFLAGETPPWSRRLAAFDLPGTAGDAS